MLIREFISETNKNKMISDKLIILLSFVSGFWEHKNPETINKDRRKNLFFIYFKFKLVLL